MRGGGIIGDPTSASRKAPRCGVSGRGMVCRATLDKQVAMRTVLKLTEEVAVSRILGSREDRGCGGLRRRGRRRAWGGRGAGVGSGGVEGVMSMEGVAGAGA